MSERDDHTMSRWGEGAFRMGLALGVLVLTLALERLGAFWTGLTGCVVGLVALIGGRETL